MGTVVAVRQESCFDGLRGEGLYGCCADISRQGRCPCGADGLYDNHPALAVGADTNLPSLQLTNLCVGFLPALFGQRRSSELCLFLAEPVAVGWRK